jgi:prepilin-type N-terminal cleavage/methylation domain-containing protein
MKNLKSSQKGFTIIELLIATAILSTMLVVVTILMLSIGSLYQKGINQAKIQNTTRQVTDDISQRLKESPGSPYYHGDGKTSTGVLCLGNTRYSYQIGQRRDATHHVLWRDTIDLSADSSSCIAANLSLAVPNSSQVGRRGVELAPGNSRLFLFKVSGVGVYKIQLGLAHGEDDLLCAPINRPGSCDVSTAMSTFPSDYQTDELLCKSKQGDQFCATARSDTTVVQRLVGS